MALNTDMWLYCNLTEKKRVYSTTPLVVTQQMGQKIQKIYRYGGKNGSDTQIHRNPIKMNYAFYREIYKMK